MYLTITIFLLFEQNKGHKNQFVLQVYLLRNTTLIRWRKLFLSFGL